MPYLASRAAKLVRPALAAVLFLAPFASAQASDDTDEPKENRFSIHGYLTQAYATSDDYQVLGIPTEGTSDYRNVAVQFRFQMTDRDSAAVQLNHEAVGRQSDEALRDDIELDWAFYRRDLGGQSHLKVGRIPIPTGIYNEVRDVGVVLPFYRAPSTRYRASGSGSLVIESIDGVLGGHTFGARSAVSLDAEAYFGGFDLTEDLSTQGLGFVDTRAENVFGVALWLNTPMPGLRFGAGGMTGKLEGDFRPSGAPDDLETVWGAVDAQIGSWLFRAEYSIAEADLLIGSLEFPAYYGQLGYTFNRHFRVYLQAQYSDLELQLPDVPVLVDVDFNEIYGIALNYFFRDNVVLKAETHWSDGYTVQDVGEVNFFGPPFETQFSILSLSASF